MRQRYTTLILHLSSYVERKKQALLTRHSWQSFFDVLLLIIAELFLAVVSIPLVLSTESVATEGTSKRYAVRRVLTRGIISIVIVLWALKIGLIFLRQWTDQRIVNVQQTEHGQVFTTPRIAAASIDATIPVPTITGISGSEQYGWVTYGTAPAHDTVALYVTRTDGSDTSIKVYLAEAGDDGAFSVHEDADYFRLKSGEYAMQALIYNETQGTKSEGSNIVTAIAAASHLETLLTHLDTIVNIAVAIVLLLGIFITLLLL